MGRVEKWRIELQDYPDNQQGMAARAAVKLCADELESRDKEIRAMAQDLIGHCDGLARHLGQAILEKLGG